MVLYYLASDIHIDDLDKIIDRKHIIATKQIYDSIKLDDYFRQELNRITELNIVVIDKDILRDTLDELDENICTIKYMFENVRFLIYSHDNDSTKDIEITKNYTVINAAHRDVEEDIEHFIDDTLDDTSLSIWIGVAGNGAAAGTTSTALKIASYIAKYDSNVCYVEANQSDDLRCMADYYLFDKLDEDHYRYNGLTLRKDKIDTTAKYLVFDFGSIKQGMLDIYNRCTVKLLVSDAKPYKMESCIKLAAGLTANSKITIVFNHAVKSDEARIANKFIDNSNINIHFNAEEPDLFSVNEDEYYELLNKYVNIIKENPRQEQAKVITRQKKSKKVFLICTTTVTTVTCVGLCIILSAVVIDRLNKLYNERQLVVHQDVMSMIRSDMGLISFMPIVEEEKPEEVVDTTEQIDIKEADNTVPVDITGGMAQHKPEDKKNPQITPSQSQSQSQEQSPESTTENSNTEDESDTHVIPVTPTVSLAGYNGQIYSGSNVVSIYNQYIGQGIAITIYKRDNTNTTDINMVDGSLSYLCQVSNNSMTFIEQ